MNDSRTCWGVRWLQGRSWRVAPVAVVVLALGFAIPAVSPPFAGAAPVLKPVVVVLCKFSDQTAEPHTVSYYDDLFSERGAGKKGAFDYWKDVSYGDLDLTGTVVRGWYTAGMTVAAFNTAARAAQIDTCATAADADVDYTKFAGVIVLTNHTGLQGPLFGGGPGTTINGTFYPNLARMAAEEDAQLSGILHEMGHLFGVNHSAKLSTSTVDYGDKYDIGSCLDCFTTPIYQATCRTGVDTTTSPCPGGPGVNSVQLRTAGWLPAARDGSWNNCSNGTFTMAALNHPEVSGNLAMRMNNVQAIPTPPSNAPGTTNSDELSVELRSKSGWDAGIPEDAFILYLHGQDGRSYWVDSADGVGGDGALVAGDWYLDAARNIYLAVNAITPAAFTGQVTLSTCKIDTVVTYTGATDGDYTDQVTVSGRLEVTGSNAPLPRKVLTFTIGGQSCQGTTGADGSASCVITLDQVPGNSTVTASFGGGPAFEAASASTAFTIDREDTTLTYGGALTSKYHDAFTASGTLVDADSMAGVANASVGFTLGSGDLCTASTGSAGVVSCEIIPQQLAGTVNIVSAFAGNTYFKPSGDSDAFEITKHETTTLYTGGTVILQGQPVLLSAQLLEHPAVPIAGRTMTINLAGQSCTGSTGPTGSASCTIATVAAPALGPQQVTASFAGDGYYLPSSETRDVIVFSFPSRGAFVLGDQTVAAATPTTTVTWWGAQWEKRNSMSGGAVSSSFEGFAAPATNPPACGSTWTASPGASSSPVPVVPSYMGTLVSSNVTKSGSTIAGNQVKIVVVRTNPGYGPNPGAEGTGTIVATYCS